MSFGEAIMKAVKAEGQKAPIGARRTAQALGAEMSGRFQFDLNVTDHARALRLMLAVLVLRGDRGAVTPGVGRGLRGGRTWSGQRAAVRAGRIRGRVVSAVSGEDAEAMLAKSLLSFLDEHDPPSGEGDGREGEQGGAGSQQPHPPLQPTLKALRDRLHETAGGDEQPQDRSDDEGRDNGDA